MHPIKRAWVKTAVIIAFSHWLALLPSNGGTQTSSKDEPMQFRPFRPTPVAEAPPFCLGDKMVPENDDELDAAIECGIFVNALIDSAYAIPAMFGETRFCPGETLHAHLVGAGILALRKAPRNANAAAVVVLRLLQDYPCR